MEKSENTFIQYIKWNKCIVHMCVSKFKKLWPSIICTQSTYVHMYVCTYKWVYVRTYMHVHIQIK